MRHRIVNSTIAVLALPVDLKLSPDALKNLKPGEQVTLQIGLRQASPAASPRTDGSMQQKNGKQ